MVPEAWKEGLSGRCVCPFGPTPLASLIIPSLHLPDSQEVTESPDRKLGPTPKRRPEEKDLGQRKMQRHSHLTVLRTEDIPICSDEPDSSMVFRNRMVQGH